MAYSKEKTEKLKIGYDDLMATKIFTEAECSQKKKEIEECFNQVKDANKRAGDADKWKHAAMFMRQLLLTVTEQQKKCPNRNIEACSNLQLTLMGNITYCSTRAVDAFPDDQDFPLDFLDLPLFGGLMAQGAPPLNIDEMLKQFPPDSQFSQDAREWYAKFYPKK